MSKDKTKAKIVTEDQLKEILNDLDGEPIIIKSQQQLDTDDRIDPTTRKKIQEFIEMIMDGKVGDFDPNKALRSDADLFMECAMDRISEMIPDTINGFVRHGMQNHNLSKTESHIITIRQIIGIIISAAVSVGISDAMNSFKLRKGVTGDDAKVQLFELPNEIMDHYRECLEYSFAEAIKEGAGRDSLSKSH